MVGIMRPPKKLSLSRILIFLPVAILALASSVVQANSEFLTNSSFTSGQQGWTGADGGAGCSSGKPSMDQWEAGALAFSYVRNTVSQTVIVPYPSTLSLKYTLQDRYEAWIEGAYRVDVSDDNQTVTSGEQVAPDQETEFELTITTTSVNENVTVSISGDDGPTIAWAGCYGPIFKSVSLIATYTDPVNVPHIYGQANENGNLTLTAPTGYRFTEPLFASYGTPSGYSLGWCHASNSVQKVTEVFSGQESATISASNGVFGDPCGGTYKKLIVAMKYEPIPGYTTTTTTLPSCPTYEPFEVTGAENGAVWGSNPYTDDSSFGVAAVHAGLIDIGETATIEPFDVQYYLSYSGTQANGVSTSDWNSGWCGYKIRLYVPPTTTTSSTTTTSTSTSTTTSTTIAPTTTESTAEVTTTTEQSTTTIPETTTTIPETTTTIPEATTTIPETTTTIPETTTTQESTTTTIPKTTTTEKVIINATSTTSTTTTSSLPEPAPDEKDEVETEVPVTTTTQPELEKAVAVITEALEAGEEISNEQATEIATNPEVLTQLSEEQAQEVFASIDVDELTDNEAAAVVAAVQLASQEVRKAFESEVNVFGGKFDTYVPVGSKVTVGERRTLVAAGAVLFVTPVVITSSTNATTSQNSPSRRSD